MRRCCVDQLNSPRVIGRCRKRSLFPLSTVWGLLNKTSSYRSVGFIDPLHRPLYVLHPSLAIRVYRGENLERADLANLRDPERVPLFAGN